MERKSKMKNEIISWIFSIAVAFILVFVCRQYLFTPIVVKGASMEPTYEEKDIIVVSKISDVKRFDQIVFQSPIEDKYYIKRVIGIPGDSIEMKDDVLYVNGKKYEEPYVKRDGFADKYTEDFTLEELTGKETVPDGCLFVLGDNRLNSKDSRFFGFISIDSVIGVSKLRIYPLNHIKIF